MFVERRIGSAPLARAWQERAVVPFPDGVTLSFSAGEVVLRRDEWLTLEQVGEVFWAAASGRELPRWLRWRGINLQKALPSQTRRSRRD
ncbi:MAG: hypothetical protein EVA89_02630 [Sandaracinaceae bacterium]|nr:MAG: hypothetical protein EVA89_02630 [Sandaracinaceae bacterium]